MLFSSSIFIFLFLPVAVAGYWMAERFGRTAMLLWLTAVSLYFYGHWQPIYLLLLLGSMLGNYWFSRLIEGGRTEAARSRWLVAAVTANLLVLGYFKYFYPVLNFLFAHGLLRHAYPDLELPLGISFFTFTQIAYQIDVRQKIARRQELVPYSVFVTVFPHLIAGPIIHPRELMPQLEKGRIQGLRSDDVALGLSWFVLGLAKKVLIADRLAPLANVVYAHPAQAGAATAWLGTLAYMMQLYFDFSGYSDMAVGLARMFSLDFPVNFNSPFKSRSIIEYWTRWHMTLSRYLNEYLYTPLLSRVVSARLDAGKKSNRKAQATPEGFVQMVAYPTLTTMFLAGIWHGAGLQFVMFGVINGVALAINHAWRALTPKGTRLHARVPAPFMVVLTFLTVMLTLVYFRSASVTDAGLMLRAMAGHSGGPAYRAFPYLSEMPSIAHFEANPVLMVVALLICFAIVWGLPNTQEILGQTGPNHVMLPNLLPRWRWRVSAAWSFGLAGLFCLCVLLLDASKTFLYFQF